MLKPTFRRFTDFRAEDVNFDFHMHTTQTDGRNSAAEMIAGATNLGLRAIAFSEHVNTDCPWFSDFKARVETVRRDAQIDVLIGIEAKPLDFEGAIDASPEVLDAAELVVGSVHRYPNGEGGLIPLAEIPNLGREKAEQIELDLALGMVTRQASRIDVLGHPMGVFSKFFDGLPESSMETLMAACRDSGVAFEISTKYCKDLGRLVELLRKTNPTVSIGSDAHAVDDIGRSFQQLKEEIARWS